MLFGRYTEVVTSGMKFVSDKLDIYFNIPFDDDPEPVEGEIYIFNLSDETINRITKGSEIILNSGYRGNYGNIFLGEINKALVEYNGVDKILTLHVADSAGKWMKTTVNKSYQPGIKASQIVRDLAGQFGIEVGEIQIPRDMVYHNGRTFSCPLETALRQLAEDCRAKLYITGGTFYFRGPGQGTETAFVLNHETGLIGTPQHVETEDIEIISEYAAEEFGAEADLAADLDFNAQVRKSDVAFEVQALLNHQIKLDSILKIESRTARGFYRVRSGAYVSNESEHIVIAQIAEA